MYIGRHQFGQGECIYNIKAVEPRKAASPDMNLEAFRDESQAFHQRPDKRSVHTLGLFYFADY